MGGGQDPDRVRRPGRRAVALAVPLLAVSYAICALALTQPALAASDPLPAIAFGSASISGVVTNAATDAPVNGVEVCAEQPGSAFCTQSNKNGEYTLFSLTAGKYDMHFADREANFVFQYYDGKQNESEATAINLTEGQTLAGIDAALKPGGVVEGKVTSARTSSALAGAEVCVRPVATPHEPFLACTITEASGDYRIERLEAGEYVARFSSSGGDYLTQFYNDKQSAETADPISVENGITTAGIDAPMQTGGEITGTVSLRRGGSASGFRVCAIPGKETAQEICSLAGAGGAYSIAALQTGEYRVVFYGQAGFVTQYYNARGSLAEADPLSVTAGSTIGGIDASLQEGGKIRGKVTAAKSGTPLGEVEACAWVPGEGSLCGSTNTSGEYTIEGLPPGSYAIRLAPRGPNPSYLSTYYPGVEYESEATDVSVSAEATVTGIDQALQPASEITGTVVEEGTDNPISGAQVCVRGGSFFGSFQCTTSAGGGGYAIGGLRSGLYRVEFDANGFVGQYYDGAASQNGAEPVYVPQDGSAQADAALLPGESISGRVTSAATGEPVAGVVACTSPATIEGIGSSCARTESNGDYTITGEAPGEYLVTFSGEGYPYQYYGESFSRFTAKRVILKSEQATTGIDDALLGGGAISGVVKAAASGEPLEGITVCPSPAGSEACVESGPSGVYKISKLSPGSYQVEFRASKGYVSTTYAHKVSVASEKTTSGIDGAMASAGSITGKVSEAGTGTPLAGAHACAYQEGSYDQLFTNCAETTSNGSYAIEGLAAGRWTVGFYAAGQTLARQFFEGSPTFEDAKAVTLEAGKAFTEVNADLHPGGEIAGTVTNGSGEPVAGAEVCAELTEEQPGDSRCVNSAANGTYSIVGLPNGLYRVEFRDNNAHYRTQYYDGAYWRSVATLVPVSAGTPTEGIDATLRKGASVSGTVTDASTDGALAGIEACMRAIAPEGEFAFNESCGLTGPGGEYALAGLTPGEYELVFRSPIRRASYERLTRRLTVAPEQADANVDAALVPGGRISGVVSDEHGAPLEGAEVCATPAGTAFGECAGTNAKGEYTIPGLDGGSYTVSFQTYFRNYVRQYYDNAARASEAQAVSVPSGGEASGIDASLKSGGEITGTVSAGGEPLRLGQVCVAWEEQSRCAFTEWNGEYMVTGLPTGSYAVWFAGGEGNAPEYYDGHYHANEATHVSVNAGAITSGIDESLGMGGTIAGKVTVAGGGKGIPGAAVCAHPVADETADAGCTTTSATGLYSLHGLDEEAYTLEFTDPGNYQKAFYDGASSAAGATPVTVALGAVKESVDEEMLTARTGPKSIGAPLISGSPIVGSKLTCSNGTWSGVAPVRFAIRWLRDDVPIPEAESPQYMAVPADGQHALTCEVTARDADGTARALSVPVTVGTSSGGGESPPAGGGPAPGGGGPAPGGGGSSLGSGGAEQGHEAPTTQVTGEPAAALAGRIRFRHDALSVPLRCTAARGGCQQLTITLTVLETLARGRVVGVSGGGGGHRHARSRLVAIGSARAMPSSGATTDVLVHLNARGRALLERWGSLPVRVEVVERSGVLAQRVVRIKG